MKVLFFLEAPLKASSGRYRVWEYLEELKQHGINGTLNLPVTDAEKFNFKGKKLTVAEKLSFYITIFTNRLKAVLTAWKYDVVFIQRGFYLPGPMLLENLLYFINKRIIYDFDDALYSVPSQYKKKRNFIYRVLYPDNKVKNLIEMSNHVIVASEPLTEYTLKYNKNVTVLSDPINTGRYKRKNHEKKK